MATEIKTPDLTPKGVVDPNAHKLEPVFKAKWIEALRSGKYAQDKGRLRSSNGFCCLGVAEDVMLPETGNMWKSTDIDNTWIEDKLDNSNHGQFLSPKLSKQINLKANGEIPRFLRPSIMKRVQELHYKETYQCYPNLTDGVDSLAMLNDRNVSFKTIATIIEEFF